MAIDKGQVNFVHFCIHDDLLLPQGRHNRQRSLESYERMCRQALERQYPNAQISLSHDTSDGAQSTLDETRLYAYPDLPESEYENEVQNVNLLCEHIAKRYEWLVPVASTRVSKSVQFRCDLPVVLVRWACINELLEGADKEDGLWEVPLDSLLGFADSIGGATAATISYPTAWKTLMWENLDGATLDAVPEGIENIIVAHDGFGLPFLGPNSSYFRLYREQANIKLTLEHFIDVEGWANPQWSYEAYCTHMKEQAARRKIECVLQTSPNNASTRIDGISLYFEDNLSLNSSIQNFVQAKINEVAELLTAAEMSLQGRPVWSKFNQENEELFRSEILYPLLCQMGFQSVRITHGSREEHGRDFVMEYETVFQELIYIGLQAKCGNINDRANSKIDELLQQVNDAFEMTYPKHEPGKPHSEAYVSYMIVAISGEYTPNALKVIRDKMIKRGFIRGNVIFWDKPKLETLIVHYCKRNSQ